MPIYAGAKGRTMVTALPAMKNKTMGQLGGASGPTRIGGDVRSPQQAASYGSPRSVKGVPFSTQGYTISGVTRDSTGGVLPGCKVLLLIADTDTKIAETISDGSGNFSFGATAGPYWLAAWGPSGVVAGITMENLTGV
jgi:hypothetical protein